MGEKEAGAEKKKDVGAEANGAITVVFKVDMHCDGCAKKISKSVKKLQGVESVHGDSTTNKLTVKGKVDPSKLRDNIEYKTKKKIQLVSPQPAAAAAAAAAKEENKAGAAVPAPEEKKKPQPAGDDDKKKEPSPSTVVFKIRLHCDGCTQRIGKIIKKFKGVQGVEIDTGKDLVMVKGMMDVKELQPYLKEKLRRGVEIIPPKKPDAGGDAKGDGEKKAKDGDGGDKKGKDGDGGDKKKDEGEKKKVGGEGGEVKKMEHHFAYENGYGHGHGHGYGYGYGQGYAPEAGYGNGYPGHLNGGYYGNPNGNAQVHGYYGNGYGNAPAPQIFSDENPNACSVM